LPLRIDVDIYATQAVFREALGDGTMEGFFRLVETFQTQEEPSFCGLSSLANVLNALSIDPGRKWKGRINCTSV
jgi:glutathione gamma-glutamylcysteinyltransferase